MWQRRKDNIGHLGGGRSSYEGRKHLHSICNVYMNNIKPAEPVVNMNLF